MGMTALGTAFWSLFAFNMQDNPNRSLDPYSAIRYKENYFLPSFIFLLAFCFLFVLDVARYAFELTNNHLLNNLMKSVQDLTTDLGLSFLEEIFECSLHHILAKRFVLDTFEGET